MILMLLVVVFSRSSPKTLMSQKGGYVVFTLNRFGFLRPRSDSFSYSSSVSSICWKFDAMRSAHHSYIVNNTVWAGRRRMRLAHLG